MKSTAYSTLLKASFVVFLLMGMISSGYSQFMLGVGGAYGDDIEQFAPNLRVYYFPNEKICFGPEFAHFPKIKEGDVERELTEYGFSGHYIFKVCERLGVFPAIGLNYAKETEVEFDTYNETTSLGLNLGGGIHLEYGRYFPYLEYKYVASGLAQNVVSVGVLFNIKRIENDKSHSIE